MINLFPITKVVTFFAVLYAIAVLMVLGLVQPQDGLMNQILLAVRMATAFNLLLVFVVLVAWRKIWEIFPILNNAFFPDLNGDWNVTIDWLWSGKSGQKNGKAKIRQNLTKISIELFTDESESESLSVKPNRDPESGRPHVFYFYRNIPTHIQARKNSERHEGTAILRVKPDNIDILEGNYFTSRHTSGRMTLYRS